VRVYREVIVPQTTKQELAELTCDVCARVAPYPRDSDPWNKDADQYHVGDVRVRMTTGSRFPDSADETTLSFDVCTTCFTDKLIPWFATFGATPSRKEEWW
jgi:hypothetical protein